MKKRILAVLIGIGLALGIGAVAATPAFAAWHGTCSAPTNGNLCLFSGFNGAGTKVEIPQDTVTQGECVNLSSFSFDNTLESLDINWNLFAVTFYTDHTCVASFGTYPRFDNVDRYNISVTDPGFENTASSFKVVSII